MLTYQWLIYATPVCFSKNLEKNKRGRVGGREPGCQYSLTETTLFNISVALSAPDLVGNYAESLTDVSSKVVWYLVHMQAIIPATPRYPATPAS